jgi:hypothetical protein
MCSVLNKTVTSIAVCVCVGDPVFLQFCHCSLPITLQNSLLLPVFFAYHTGSKKWKNFPIRPLGLPGVLLYDLYMRH